MSIGVVDLFCGIGGLSYGIKQAGLEVVAGVDSDKSCEYPYEFNNDAKFIGKNIAEVSGKEIRHLLQGYNIKVLVGCAPCQPFSSHRKDKSDRKSHKDWSLLYEFLRIIEECKPHIISMENVPAIIEEIVFVDFTEKLKELGYYVDYSIINVADYGIPQRRRRLVLFASKKYRIKLIAPTHINNHSCIRSSIGDLPPLEAGKVYGGDNLHTTANLSSLNLKRIRASRPNGTWRDWPDELILKCHKKQSGQSYGSVYGRMDWDGLSPTITTQFTSYGTGRFGHPSQDRALSLREGALLQSFPISYRFTKENETISLKGIARHIGNAVPPKLGEIIGKSILNCLPRKKQLDGGE